MGTLNNGRAAGERSERITEDTMINHTSPLRVGRIVTKSKQTASVTCILYSLSGTNAVWRHCRLYIVACGNWAKKAEKIIEAKHIEWHAAEMAVTRWIFMRSVDWRPNVVLFVRSNRHQHFVRSVNVVLAFFELCTATRHSWTSSSATTLKIMDRAGARYLLRLTADSLTWLQR